MKRYLIHLFQPFWTALLLCVLSAPGHAQYADWTHSGTVLFLTTPEGADLPASARETDVPVLVRLHSETFDFSEAQPGGSDFRVSLGSKPLAYQIEVWDAAAGEAAIWVRVPELRGNARQRLTLHWGKANTASESNGKAVFNASNGYCAVLHLDENLVDETGMLSPVNKGSETCRGAVGLGRRFEAGKGIACGEKILGLPVGAGPFSTHAWVRAEQVNGRVVGWGNEQGQGKTVMSINSPPHVRMDCYFSNANVSGTRRFPMSEWAQVVHTFEGGEARLYLNGQLDSSSIGLGAEINIRRPARMWLGGWYNRYNFVGAIDEVRVSTVPRSADWIKLAYENQKENQTLVGTLVTSEAAGKAAALTLSTERIELAEGESTTVKAEAIGAEKVYWLLQRGEAEEVVSDRFSFTVDAGRVTHDTDWSLQYKAIYPDSTTTRDIPISIRNTIPEPRFSLEAPSNWNGRDEIEVRPRIENLVAMSAAGAGELRTRWRVSGGAVTKDVLPDRLVLRRTQYSGPIHVTAFIDNGGAAVAATVEIEVLEPATDAWVARLPEADEKPVSGQFYARDDKNQGHLFYRGQLDQDAKTVFLKLFADEQLILTEVQAPTAERRYDFALKLAPGLITYRVEFGSRTAEGDRVLDRVGGLLCGDAYLIEGQSNALATDTREDAARLTNRWVRSYGGPTGRGDGAAWLEREVKATGDESPNLWCSPVWKKNAPEHLAHLGWWGMELAGRLVESQQVPVCIIQAAVGGSRIDEHVPTAGNRADLDSMYGRLLWRVQQARLTHGIRAVIWHQGENDQGAAGPTGGYGWESYQDYFVEMAAAWKDDMPNIQHYYLFQIWPNACSMGGREGSGDRLREAQRTLPRLFSNMSILSTLGIQPPGGCHFPLEGWGAFASMLQPMIERDLNGVPADRPLSPPDLLQARFTSAARNEVALTFDQPITWDEALVHDFALDDEAGVVASGEVSGDRLTLRLNASSAATTITYLRERDWKPERLLRGKNGLAALTFCDVPLSE